MNNTTPSTVIAQYLTVAGATVDIRPVADAEWDDRCEATCAGCGANDWQSHYRKPVNDLDSARRWAQAHAEKCRALPRPEQETAS